jgi:uncharacterized protein (TIGR04551 family)
VYFEYKTQAWESSLASNTPLGATPSPLVYEQRNLKMYSPDLWAKVGLGRITLEAELVGQLGSVDLVASAPSAAMLDVRNYNIRKYGGSGRFTFRGFEGKLRLGLESGFASGDQWDNIPQGATNLAYANPFGDPAAASGATLSQFAFNRDYKVDLILWRHLVGAVSNAAYFKPFVQYDITRSITFKVANVTSLALKKVATPGNDRVYGTEFDGDLGYAGNGLFVGISYGVLFPLGAMGHPDTVAGYSDPTTMATNTGSASTAHTIQSRFVLAF